MIDDLVHVLLLRDYNTRVVVIGVALLGIAAGVIGSFMLLRKRSLLGDALSHATLPGIAIAFMVMTLLGGTGKWLPGLLIGATLSGSLGIICILFIVNLTRIKEDAALGIVLSVFFGLGVALTGIIQGMGTGHAAGLKSFIYGKTASMLYSDAVTILVAAALVVSASALLFKEFKLLCFDAAFARAQGWPVVVLDVVLMTLVVAVTVIGLQAVGLILMIALLVIPPAAARFWTNNLGALIVVSATIGGVSGWAGAAVSALVPRMPAGAIIVVAAGVVFGLSMIFGAQRGVLRRWMEHRRSIRRTAEQHLLRALYELHEAQPIGATSGTSVAELSRYRAWNWGELSLAIARARRDGAIAPHGDRLRLTPQGEKAAWRMARNHRLWEIYLIMHADIAPSHVDRDADEVEHVLEPALIVKLEEQLAREYPDLAIPQSPHQLAAAAAASGGAA